MLKLGQVVITPGALAAVEEDGYDAFALVIRHQNLDYGEVCAEDRQANEQALVNGARVMSVYTLPRTKVKVWVITEADRSSTCILLPEEY